MEVRQIDLDGLKCHKGQVNRKLSDFIREENFIKTHGKEHNDFQCRVCLTLPDAVRKCGSCEGMLCVPCLDKMGKKAAASQLLSCPLCRESAGYLELSRMERAHMNGL